MAPEQGSSQGYAESFGDQWQRYARTQLDSHSGTTISETRFAQVTGWKPEDLAGRRVLDAGCGAGRFAEIAIKWGAQVTAVDMSDAVLAARANVRNAEKATFFKGDCFHLPPGEPFDLAYSIGVAQHTPDPLGFVRAVAGYVRPGGQAAFWIYERILRAWLHPKYVFRPITKRLTPSSNLILAQGLVRTFFPVAKALRSIPRPLRRIAYRALPIACYLGELDLSDEAQQEWSELDTLDMYSPRFDNPQRYVDVEKALLTAGAKTVRRRPPGGIAVVADL